MSKENEIRFIENLPRYRDYLVEFGMDETKIPEMLACWAEPHRHFHTLDHLYYIISKIEDSSVSAEKKKILIVVAIFHDIVYDPRLSDNEVQSVSVFEKYCTNTKHKHYDSVKQIILDTINHEPSSAISKTFCKIDSGILDSDLGKLIEYEHKIFKEYQFVDYATYKEERIKFLKNWIIVNPGNIRNVTSLIEYIETREPKIGIFAGSFNPMHLGHLNVLEKAENIFDKVIVAVGVNPEKKGGKQKALQNAKTISDNVLPYRQVVHYTGFLTDFIRNMEYKTTLIRGLRDGGDFEFELRQLKFMREMNNELDVVYIPCDSEYQHLSSSSINMMESIEKGSSYKYLPEQKKSPSVNIQDIIKESKLFE